MFRNIPSCCCTAAAAAADAALDSGTRLMSARALGEPGCFESHPDKSHATAHLFLGVQEEGDIQLVHSFARFRRSAWSCSESLKATTHCRNRASERAVHTRRFR